MSAEVEPLTIKSTKTLRAGVVPTAYGVRPIAIASALALLAGLVWIAISVVTVRADVDSARAELKNELATFGGMVSLIRADIDALGAGGKGMEESDVTELLAEPELRTDAEVAEALGVLSDQSKAEDYARVIADVDEWTIRPEDAASVNARLANLMTPFRAAVKSQVLVLQSDALKQETSSAGVAKLDQAAQTLSVYPISDEPDVLKEARQLADQQVEAVTRLEGLRRQRYNHWALIQVARAIDYYNGNAKGGWNPLRDNADLIEPLAGHLGLIDPQFLEPATAELYGYIIGKTRAGLSDVDKVKFAKRIIDPATGRKTLGDF